MQRRIPGGIGVGIGALFQQPRRDGRLVAVRRDDQRAGADRSGIVHVGARRQQERGGFDIPLLRGEEQRRETALLELDAEPLLLLRIVSGPVSIAGHETQPRPDRRAGLDIGAGVDQQAHDVGVTLRGGPHQRRLAARALAGVDVGAAARAAPAPTPTVRCAAATISAVSPEGSITFGFAPAFNSSVTIAGPASLQATRSGVTPRSVAVLTFAPARISRLGGVHVVPVGGPVQRGGAIGLRRVHVDARKQRQERLGVPVLDGRGETCVVGAVGRAMRQDRRAPAASTNRRRAPS